MDAALLAQVGLEAAANPMGQGAVHLMPSRVLLADGDALAYSMAGNDATPAGAARRNLLDKVASAASIAGAGGIIILTTAASSHKGFRFAVARSKPYQGHRKSGRKPKNWQFLRESLELGSIPNVELTTIAEADDLFGKYATQLTPERVVIYTEDKDMRMVPGWHLDWMQHTMHFVPEGTWEIVYNDKVFGRKWFWLQMLQGDQADNIPGLPARIPNGTRADLIGPATAVKMLAHAKSDLDGFSAVRRAYVTYYGEDKWMVEFLEQAILLWMRRDAFSSWNDVLSPGNPLEWLYGDADEAQFIAAVATMKQRIKESL